MFKKKPRDTATLTCAQDLHPLTAGEDVWPSLPEHLPGPAPSRPPTADQSSGIPVFTFLLF